MSRSGQLLVGGGIAAVGALTVLIAILIAGDSGEARELAERQQSFVQATCTVEQTDVKTGRDAEGSEYATVTVHFKHRIKDNVYSDLTYTYPDYAYNPASARQAASRELEKGAQITCFHAPDDPRDAVLMKVAPPTGAPPSPLAIWGACAAGVLFTVLGLYMALSKRRWKLSSDNDL
ncbi:MAG: DUF3592 domain-containing protein [Polyangiaceae bacterium]